MDTSKIAKAWHQVEVNGADASTFTIAAIGFVAEHESAALENAARLYAKRGRGRTAHSPIVDENGAIRALSWSLLRPLGSPEHSIAVTALAVCALPEGLAKPDDQYLVTHGSIQKSIYEKDLYDRDLNYLMNRTRPSRTIAIAMSAIGIFIAILISFSIYR